jgi:hypothetical protein
VGALVGVVDGYGLNGGKPVPAALPTASWEGQNFGLNFVLIPQVEKGAASAIAVQLKWRLR